MIGASIAILLTMAAAFGVLLLAVLEAYRHAMSNLSSVAAQLDRAVASAYTQSEALASVVATTRLEFPLPPTRGWAASPDFLNHLCQIIMTRRPSLVVEASSGVSTLVVAACLRRLGRGRVISLEHDAAYAEASRQLIRLHQLDNVATIADAPLARFRLDSGTWLWYDTSALPSAQKIDVLVVDGPPWHVQPFARYPALPVLYDRLAPDCAIVLHDGDREEERTIVERWTREFPDLNAQYLEFEKGAYAITRRARETAADQRVVRTA